MSEYTSVYLREKAAALLSFRDNPTAEELEGKSEEEVRAIILSYNYAQQTTKSLAMVARSQTIDKRPAGGNH